MNRKLQRTAFIWNINLFNIKMYFGVNLMSSCLATEKLTDLLLNGSLFVCLFLAINFKLLETHSASLHISACHENHTTICRCQSLEAFYWEREQKHPRNMAQICAIFTQARWNSTFAENLTSCFSLSWDARTFAGRFAVCLSLCVFVCSYTCAMNVV